MPKAKNLSHLDHLEAESIHIIREVAAEFRNPVMLYSIGKDWATFSSADQVENTGATLGGGPSGANYRIASDRVFVRTDRSDLPGSEFDDLVIWVPENTLYARLVQVGQLP